MGLPVMDAIARVGSMILLSLLGGLTACGRSEAYEEGGGKAPARRAPLRAVLDEPFVVEGRPVAIGAAYGMQQDVLIALPARQRLVLEASAGKPFLDAVCEGHEPAVITDGALKLGEPRLSTVPVEGFTVVEPADFPGELGAGEHRLVLSLTAARPCLMVRAYYVLRRDDRG